MKKMPNSNGMDINGTMEARHSFTTQVTRRQGMEFTQETLCHTTLSTTQSETKKEMADMLMNFEEPKSKPKTPPVMRIARKARIGADDI